jgi:hypothetical protein
MIDYYNGGIMIDNSHLSEFVKSSLRHLSYEYKINIYDKNCSGCAFKKITTVDERGNEKEHKELNDAINDCLFVAHVHIIRGCQYGGDEYTLEEIVTNTCRLWYKETEESDEPENNEQPSFMEIKSIEDRDIRKICIGETISQ